MRFIVGFLLLGGAIASSDLFYPSNQELQFEYEGKLLTGIPQLDSHYAGITIKSKVVLQTQDGENFKFALKEPQYVTYNQKLSGPSPQNWRTVQTPSTQGVPAEQKRFLESPVQFRMQNGKVSSIQVSGSEPQWSSNFKKGLVSLFKIQTDDLGSQSGSGQSPIAQAIQQGASVQAWKVMEQDLVGTCEHDYIYTEVPRANLPQQDRQLIEQTHCPSGSKVFKVEKSRNIDRCVQRSVYYLTQPGYFNCMEGNCPGMWDRSSITKFLGCKQSNSQYRIQAILNEGEIQQSIFGQNMEQVVSGVNQTLVLVSASSQLSSLPQIASPQQQDEIFYEHTQPLSQLGGGSGSSGQGQSPRSFYQQQEQLRTQESNPSQQRYAFTLPQGDQKVQAEISPEKVKQKAKQLIEEIVQNLNQPQNFKSTLTSSKALSLTEMVSLLSTQEIQSLWQSVESSSQSQQQKSQMKQLIWEVVILSGSNPSIMFIIDAAQKGQVSELQVKEAIVSLPHYIRTPTKQILQQLFQFIKSPAAAKTQGMKTQSHMAFATILHQACLSSKKTDRFGQFVFGEFCNSKDSELTSQYIPYFVQQLQSAQTEEQQIQALFPLGAIGHESVISQILPYVEGKQQQQQQSSGSSSSQVQRMAIYALNVIAAKSRSKVLPVLSSIVKNQYEDRYVRIAALSMALTAKPELTFFQNLATSTWYEDDVEFQKFVLSTLRSLGRLNSQPKLANEDLRTNARYAQSVLPMARPQPGVISSQLQYFTDQWLQTLGIGQQSQGFLTSLLSTKSIYVKVEYLLQKLSFRPVEFAADISGLENGDLIQKLKQELIHEPMSSRQSHSELSDIMSQLNVKPYTSQPFMLNLWVRLMDDVNIVTVIGQQDAQKFTDFIKSSLTDGQSWRSMVCGQSQVNFVKVNNLAQYQLLAASEMGLPIVSEVHMPVVAKVSGNVNVQCGSSSPSVEAELQTKVAGNFMGYMSTYSPFTQEWISTGIDKQMTINSPAKTSISASGNGGLKVKLDQSQASSGASNIDVAHYSVKPFSVIKPITYLDAVPMNAHRNIKYISTGVQHKERQYPIGQSLGLDMHLNLKTESDVVDLKTVQEYMRNYHYNPLSMAMFSFTHSGIKIGGRPSVRYHDVTLVYNPQASSTKSAEVEVQMTVGKTHMSKTEEIMIVKKDNKYAVESQAIGSSQISQKLGEALQKLNVKSGYGVSMEVKAVLAGSEQKTVEYSFTAGQGSNNAEQKWNVNIVNKNNPSSKFNLCMNGQLSLPNLPWNSPDQQSQGAQFSFSNKAGFGQGCTENTVTVTGSTQVSDRQLSKSKSSGDRHKCREAKSQLEKIRSLIKKADQKRDWHERSRLEQEEIKEIRRAAQYCSRQMKLASVLDQVQFRINYKFGGSQSGSSGVATGVQYVDNVVEAYFLPYLYQVAQRQNAQNQVNVQLKFQPESKTFDASVETPQRSLSYVNIRIPYVLRQVLPMNARSRPSMQIFKSLTGQELYPKCTLRNDVITTYDNRTYAYRLDDCYHLAVADCTNTKSHGVLVKATADGKKQVKLYVKSMYLEAKPVGGSGSSQQFQVTVDGQQSVTFSQPQQKEFVSQDGQNKVQVQMTPDHVLVVDTPFSRVVLEGSTVQIEKTDVVLAGEHCGLCGNHDGDRKADIKDARQCVVKTPRAAALSYRIERSCSEMSEYKKKIKATETACLRKTVEKTPVTSFLSTGASYGPGGGSGNDNRCSQTHHKIIHQGNEICISQVPILECGGGCVARARTTKTITFTCLPADRPRLVELYEDKVRRGEFLPELKSMEHRFERELSLPLSCGPPGQY